MIVTSDKKSSGSHTSSHKKTFNQLTFEDQKTSTNRDFDISPIEAKPETFRPPENDISPPHDSNKNIDENHFERTEDNEQFAQKAAEVQEQNIPKNEISALGDFLLDLKKVFLIYNNSRVGD